MLDGVTLDQMRAFIAAADHGSFPPQAASSAARSPSSARRWPIWKRSSGSKCSIVQAAIHA